MRFISDMRERPQEERVAFAAIAAVGVAFVLFIIWSLTFFRGTNEERPLATPEGQQASVIESFRESGEELNSLLDEASGQYADLRALLEAAQEDGEVPPFETAVELTVDKDGDVQAQNVIVPQDEGE